MRLYSVRCLIIAASAAIFGCEPRPVVVDDKPDAVDVDVDTHRDVVEPAPRTGVDVNVGGGRGVDVNVTPNPSSAPDTPEQKTNP